MAYAVILYFDPQTEQAVSVLQHHLLEPGLFFGLQDAGIRPHVSLAGFADADRARLISTVQEYAAGLQPFAVKLDAIGIFPSDENVLFLSPVPAIPLLTLHRELHDRLAKAQLVSSPYYLPGSWIPHCTLGLNVPAFVLPKAVEILAQAFKPIHGQFQHIGVVEYWPLKQLAEWPLTAK